MKKAIAFALSVLMLISLTVPAFADKGGDAASRGFAYLQVQDYESALPCFLEADQAGNTQVQFFVGQLYEYGYGVKKDLVTAVKWYLKAESIGDSRGAEKLEQEPLRTIAEAMSVQEQATRGFAYMNGDGVEQDFQKAWAYFLVAADAGKTNVLFSLAELYENGYGVTRDPDAAREWYQLAASAGDLRAADKLRQLSSDGGAGTAPARGAAADGQDPAAQGYAYLNGDGVAQDDEKALECFLKAAQNGNTEVLYVIGEMFEKGRGTKRDLVTAVKYYRAARDAGDERAADKLKHDPLASVAQALSVQKQATHVEGSYGEREFFRGPVYPFYLLRPLVHLRDITLVITLRQWLGGWPYGNWYFYVRDNNGNWHHSAAFRITQSLGEGNTMMVHLDLDQEETCNAIAVCGADSGMDYTVQLDVEYIASEENFGSYSSTLLQPIFTPVGSSLPIAHRSYDPPKPSTGNATNILEAILGDGVGEYKGDYVSDYGSNYGSDYGMKAGVCFTAGTPVQTENGLVPIEEIRAGDLVWSWNEQTDRAELKPVVETYVNPCLELATLSVCGETITCTPRHRFYVPQKGWTRASELQAGDTLILLSGKSVEIDSIRFETFDAPVTVYNFQVRDDHSYYVGQSGVRVHNAGTEGGYAVIC